MPAATRFALAVVIAATVILTLATFTTASPSQAKPANSWTTIAKAPTPTAAPAEPEMVRLNAAGGWSETNLHLRTGEAYTVTNRTGAATADHRNPDKVGPTSYAPDVDQEIYQVCTFDTSWPNARLIGKVGRGGSPFSVGNGGGFVSAEAGILFLRMGDGGDCLADNIGYVEVDVQATCSSVFFLSARGSGELQQDYLGMGNVGHDTFLELRDAAVAAGRSIEGRGLIYPARSVSTLITQPGKSVAGVLTGMENARALLRKQAKECPDQKLVLSGYSQGAWVMGELLFMSGVPDVDGLVLFGDPRFAKKADGIVHGSLDRNGVVRVRDLLLRRPYLPEDSTIVKERHAWSYCARQDLKGSNGKTYVAHDVVCNFSAADPIDLAACATLSQARCSHLAYVRLGITDMGVEFLNGYLFR